jgi:hypothetical protein
MRLVLAIVTLTACNHDFGLTPRDLSADQPADEGVTDPETEDPDEDPIDDPVEDPIDDPVEDPEDDPVEDPPDEDDCDETSDLVYVIDRADEALYLFDPTTTGFEYVGDLDCAMWGEKPASMSVARDGVAYVRYSDNTVYAVDLATMDCSPTPYASGFGAFGMGFATDSADTWRDKLYIANADKLAVLSTGDWSLGGVGSMKSQSELTGNAAGELWAFLPLEQPAQLVQLDKETGASLASMSLPSFPNPGDLDAFAFATWGGDFWLFVRTYGMGNSTDVYRVSPDGTFTSAAEDTGMDVVGAGVSTCAPS